MGKSRSSAFVFAAAYLALVVGLFLALGGAAYAQSPPSSECTDTSASNEYCTQVEEVSVKGAEVSSTTEGDTASAVATEAEALPNTGLSLLGVVVVGGALVAAGLALRRREQRKN